MKLTNTLSRKVEEFQSLEDKSVTIYSCGPTVYDHMHIGNLSAAIYNDTLRRILKASGFDVKHVMNVTDIDDKTIARSAEQHPDDDPMIALKNLTSHYSEIFFNDLRAIGFDVEAVKFVNATDSIAEMQKLITELYEKKFAYITEDGVYFSIKTYKDSGKKYGQLSEVTVDSTSQARIQNDEYDKESAHDFALWKIKTGNEPAWEFELDGHQLAGRPGWHIECSAMSVNNLGMPFDIHTGGVDLIFPHHENEIAQSTATDGQLYARYFVHNEHLMVDGRKMSKSLNNFYTLRDIIEKKYDPIAFRLMVLQSHYKNQSNFTWENLAAAQNRLKDYRAMAVLRWQSLPHTEGGTFVLNESKNDLLKILQDDLNTPAALALLSEIANQLNVLFVDSSTENRYSNVEDFSDFLKFLDDLLGLELMTEEDISAELKDILAEREKARESKDWSKADQLRNQLEDQGIGLKDTDKGAIWYRL